MQQNTGKQDSSVKDYYSKAQFWDQRYIEKGGFFDWYAEFPELKYAFETQYGMSHEDHILMVGCGNSKLSQQMYEAGYRNIVNIDISPAVIQQMKEVSPEMEWLAMDALNMTFQDKKFDYVIDKGTMDALIAGRDLTPSISLLVQCMRVTKQEGQLILITYGSPEGRKKIFQESLPFSLYDYYFAYVNLNDMSTMINLMRNNLIGPDGQKINKEEALQKSMKQFMMIKIMRQRRSKDKQFVIWQNYMKQQQPIIQNKSNQAATQSEEKQKIQGQLKDDKTQTPLSSNKEIKAEPTIRFTSKSQKQSYVYAYSIKRKLGWNYNSNSIQNYEILDQYKGNENARGLQINGTNIKLGIAKSVQYCKQKIIAHSNIDIIEEGKNFTTNEKTHKLKILDGNSIKLKLLRKTNLRVKINFKDLTKTLNFLPNLCRQLLDLLDLKLHPCPKTFSLFSMIKTRMKAKSSNSLLEQYWYPTYKIQNVDLTSNQLHLILSIPPVLPSTLSLIQEQIASIFSKNKQLTYEILSIHNGYISFPEIELFGVLNIVSLSHNNGQSLCVQMQDFWSSGSQQIKVDQSQSDLFIVSKSTQIEVDKKLLEIVLLHLMILL